MSLQIRVTDADGSNSVVLDKAADKRLWESVSSSDEGVTFTYPKNDSKAQYINPYTTGYARFWEVWETSTNTRLNYGPLTSIVDGDTEFKVEGAGRSSLLADFYKSKKIFNTPIDAAIDDVRYENIAIEPKSTTLIHDTHTSASGNLEVFGTVTPDEKYYVLSKNTKDTVIDDQAQWKAGDKEPHKSYYYVDSYWKGMSTNDALIVDLGSKFDIEKLRLVMPWWNGLGRTNNRAFDFTLDYAVDDEAPLNEIQDRNFGPFHNIFDTGPNSTLVPNEQEWNFYLGTTASGTAHEVGATAYTLLDQAGPVPMRYIRVNISDVHTWFSSTLSDDDTPVDAWNWSCNPDYTEGMDVGFFKPTSSALMKDKVISDRYIEPQSDCHASIIELGAYKKIVNRDVLKPLALQRIDNNNLAITYFHVPASTETKTTPQGFRKFEPGSFFRNVKVTYTGATTTYNKFFNSDCNGCYGDGFNFAIVDNFNNLCYVSDSASATSQSIKLGALTRQLIMKGASDATIVEVDGWQAKSDALSWGGSYSYSHVTNDWFKVHFKGESFDWYATIPADKTGATVSIEIRSKTTGSWSSWSTLEASYTLPNNIWATKVYSISYESGQLASDTVYEIRITNLDGNYCSVDSIGGYWAAAMNHYNEDNSRVKQYRPEYMEQIYDGRFSAGSMLKFSTSEIDTFGLSNGKGSNSVGFSFTGDRIIVVGAKGKNFGKIRIQLINWNNASGFRYYDYGGLVVQIPGTSASEGYSKLINLDTTKSGNEIMQAIIFDSNDSFSGGLPWGRYTITAYYRADDNSKYNAHPEDFSNFQERCKDCDAPTSETSLEWKPVFIDGFYAHEALNLSVDFVSTTHLDILKSITEAVQTEWAFTEQGIRVEPRIGQDTEIVLREGQNTLVSLDITNDITKVASMLLTSGGDIDGLPLFTITEDRKNREILGRTVTRQHDFRNVLDYLQLIGLSRIELRRRSIPEKRISVTHVANNLALEKGDSFNLWTKKLGKLRVRIMRKEISEDTNSGRTYNLECITWPQID